MYENIFEPSTYEKILRPIVIAEEMVEAGDSAYDIKANLLEILAKSNAGARDIIGGDLFVCTRLSNNALTLRLWLAPRWSTLAIYVRERILASLWEAYRRLYIRYSNIPYPAVSVLLLGPPKNTLLGRRTAYSSYVIGGEYHYYHRKELY